MNMRCEREEGLLTVFLEGELDHHCAMDSLREMLSVIEDELPPRLTLDFSKVSFMDSSGIAVIMGVYKKIKAIGSSFTLSGAGPQPLKVLRAAGIDRMVKII